jgi:hypothetical protein
MADTFKGIITADGKKRQLPYGAVLDKPVSDKTLSEEGGFADAKAVGDKFAKVDSETASLKEDLSNKITKFYASNQGEAHITDSDNGKIQDMMIYGKSSQDGTPTPENPVEIKSVVNPTVKVCGKNLLNPLSMKKGQISTDDGKTINEQENYYHSDYIPMIGTSLSLFYGSYVRWFLYDKNKNFISSNSINAIGGKTVTISECNYIRIHMSSIKVPDNLMIAYGTDASFEPYRGQTVTLLYTLNAIPVSSGGNVTIDGQQYVSDYVDVERGKVVKRVKVLNISNLDKSKWGFRTDTSEAIGRSTRYYGTSSMLDFDTNINAMSNIAIYGGIGHDVQGTFRLVDAETYLYQFNLDKTKFDKVQDFTDYLASNNVYIQYALKVPQELDLKPEEIVLFKSLSANYPVTNIFINSEQLDGYTVFNYPISMANIITSLETKTENLESVNYTDRGILADTDAFMVNDGTGMKKSVLSKLSDFVLNKIADKVFAKLQTNDKTILGAINELNSNSSGLKFIDAGIITQAEAQSADQAAQIVFDNKIPVSEGIIVFVNFIFAFRYSMIVQKYERGDYGAYILFGCNVPTLTYHTKTAGTWN